MERGIGVHRERGLSLVELLVVIAILAIMLGMSVMYLNTMAAPTRSAGEMIEALLNRVRSEAMATTTVHRIRPTAADTLVVETSTACSSGTWTWSPDMDLELPRGVTLTDTTWSLCFNSRGIASANLTLTVQDEAATTQQLEILRGGEVRWVD